MSGVEEERVGRDVGNTGKLAAIARKLQTAVLDLELHDDGRGTRDRPSSPGAYLHSTLGMALRRVGCGIADGCAGAACRDPLDCAYGRLLEPRPRFDDEWPHSRGPVARLVVQAPWEWPARAATLAARIVILSPWPEALATLDAALASRVLVAESQRRGAAIEPTAGWQHLAPVGEALEIDRRRALLRLRTPLELLVNERVLRQLDGTLFFRRLAWRISCWACDFQLLPWPGAFPDLERELADVTVERAATRFVSFERYSGRQHAEYEIAGLVGEVVLSGVGPSCWLLLQLAERCGAGKSASYGAGWISVEATHGRGISARLGQGVGEPEGRRQRRTKN